MDKSAKAFLFGLLETPSPTGFEMAGQRKWASYVKTFSDTVECDAYGNTWATLHGTAKGVSAHKDGEPFKLMIEAHADEIGYMIKYITDDGFLRIDRIGGSDHANGRGRKVIFQGSKGPVRGVIGNTAIHIRERASGEKTPEIHELYVDVGASSAKEVAKLGLRIGHAGVYADTVEEFGEHRLLGRALDNRIGGFIIAEVMRRLAKEKSKLHATVYAVNAVQEEIGGFGARMITHRLFPDAALCLDVCHATDTPGIDKAKHGAVKLGAGLSITHGTCCHPVVIERLLQVCDKAEIPVQHESSSRFSGTDTDDIFQSRSGVPSALISLPLRYMHSVVECVDLRDVERVIEAMTKFALSVRPGDYFGHVL
jgi:putative aminopeptidase FrvX